MVSVNMLCEWPLTARILFDSCSIQNRCSFQCVDIPCSRIVPLSRFAFISWSMWFRERQKKKTCNITHISKRSHLNTQNDAVGKNSDNRHHWIRRKTITKENPRNICSLSVFVCECICVCVFCTNYSKFLRRWMRLMAPYSIQIMPTIIHNYFSLNLILCSVYFY